MESKRQRSAGVLLHITSLPNGCLDEHAYRFVDFLQTIGATIWQTLPLNPPHADGSPYQCLSAHAGNTAFIDLRALVKHGWVQEGWLDQTRDVVLEQAYQGFIKLANQADTQKFKAFCVQHEHWLNDYALFLVLRHRFMQAGWNSWPEEFKSRQASALDVVSKNDLIKLDVIKFAQFIFFEQWSALKAYANARDVSLFGDIPIFVAFDSADVWANPEQFKLDHEGSMTVVAGVPPDYFSETGQRWGNPHYRWDVMLQDDFQWWCNRMRTQQDLFDYVRIDHFRGLEAAWEIPSSEPTAINGQWIEAPGGALLEKLTTQFPNVALIAEDLGIITPEVDALRLKYQLPGMKILQFAFSGETNNPYLPENIEENSVVYTGTHDNDTTLGWYQSLSEEGRQHVLQYFGAEQLNMPSDLVKLALATNAKYAIIPMQDILQLDATHRMNVPGTTEGNWSWRFEWTQLSDAYADEIKQAIHDAGR